MIELDPQPTATLRQAALWYAKTAQLHVFPLQPSTKFPVKGSRGCKDATTDLDQIRAWWDGNPDYNIGIATGHVVDVIDLDGTTANKWLAGMLDNPTRDDPYHGRIPNVLGVVTTPRPGGRHLYIAAAPGRGNKAALAPSVDYRGTGGYVVAPPSILDNRPGQYAGQYRWSRDLEVTA